MGMRLDEGCSPRLLYCYCCFGLDSKGQCHCYGVCATLGHPLRSYWKCFQSIIFHFAGVSRFVEGHDSMLFRMQAGSSLLTFEPEILVANVEQQIHRYKSLFIGMKMDYRKMLCSLEMSAPCFYILLSLTPVHIK